MASFIPLNGTTRLEERFEKLACEWIPAQQSVFQFSNFCFLAAFIVPRSYKLSVLSLRASLFLGFILSSIWASTDVCAMDALIWYCLMALVNGVYTVKLCKKFMPPTLSTELMELYLRVLKPLKISQKHFRELTREASIMELTPGQCYAVEDVTASNERLSILLRGRFNVTCEGTQLHHINAYQFVDSPEWMASYLMHSEPLFQVTITAAEDCVYLCWQIPKLNRILQHRPQLLAVFSSIIGKDVTHKMYSLNEQLGQAKSYDDQTRAAHNDHWRQAIYRSVSFDALNTGTKGTVRSDAWKRYRQRKTSIFSYNSDDTSRGQRNRKCWIPIVSATQIATNTPFMSMDGQSGTTSGTDDENEIILPVQSGDIPLYRLGGKQSIALIPVVMPVVPNTAGLNHNAQRLASMRRHSSHHSNREVKFNETIL
ncbi:blood vessel epicardial substance-B-like [Daktulosphaira vitifoliae]|uniref:blood vessel epicardial substance-B-like n=1 Tax=Daktulosphaira vitifoliae TaxID=58002 RepID=UPI0021AAF23F|nr:blood vessel epicardial substance-B-like [Daktulosphaira vitifoliae]